MMHYPMDEVMAMRFSTLMKLISPDNPLKILHCTDLYEIFDVELIDGTQSEYTNTTLYFGYLGQLSGSALPAQCVLVRTPESEALTGLRGDAALAESPALFFLFNAARQRVDADRGRGLYAELTDAAARAGSIEPVINLAASKLGNSVVLLDSDFKVLAHSTVFPIDDPLWAENIRQGYCSYEFVTAVAELEAVKNAPPTSDPVVVTCYASPLRKLSSKIFLNGKLIGIVLMLEKETPISPMHMELLPIISAAAGDAIARHAPYLIPGNTVYQKLLYDLLIGASPAEIAPRIARLSFSPRLCALCVRQTRYLGQKHLKEDAAAGLVRLLPGTRFTFHEGGIAALVPLGDQPDLSDGDAARLEELARSERLQIGVSNLFFRPEHFADRYRQARRALELSARLSPESPVCRYAALSFYDLLDRAPDPAALGLFCHPALAVLSRYDHANGTDLYHTLGMYLDCGCIVKETAERLFIHRNSLNYRLERIRELTQARLEDSNVRFLLTMSYRIDHFTGRDQ